MKFKPGKWKDPRLFEFDHFTEAINLKVTEVYDDMTRESQTIGSKAGSLPWGLISVGDTVELTNSIGMGMFYAAGDIGVVKSFGRRDRTWAGKQLIEIRWNKSGNISSNFINRFRKVLTEAANDAIIKNESTHLPNDATERKAIPVGTGFIDYFPDAMVAVAKLSKIGNDQHNPGKPLHWDRSKSGDESDALMRHFLERGTIDTDGVRHSAKVAWRAMALLQKELEHDNKRA